MIKLITGKDGYQWAVLKNDTHQSRWVEQHGSMLTDETLKVRVLPTIKSGDWIVDAGANIGSHTVPYAEAVGPTGKVIAFEPVPQSFACLLVNTRGFDNVIAFHRGLSNAPGFKLMEIDPNAGASRIKRGASLVKGTEIELIGQLEYFCPLDYYDLGKLDFLKIDVEGHEIEVLMGARETIKRCRPRILCEVNEGTLALQGHSGKELVERFKDLHYEPHFLEPEHGFHLPMVDVMFEPK